MRTINGPIYTLRHYERGIQEKLGKYHRFILPGLGFQIPLVQIIRFLDVRVHTLDIHPQPVITKDNVEIRVDGIICGCALPLMKRRSKKLSTTSTIGRKRSFSWL